MREQELVLLEERIDWLEADLEKAIIKHGDNSPVVDALSRELTDAIQEHYLLTESVERVEEIW